MVDLVQCDDWMIGGIRAAARNNDKEPINGRLDPDQSELANASEGPSRAWLYRAAPGRFFPVFSAAKFPLFAVTSQGL
jgi:hypothetical protein